MRAKVLYTTHIIFFLFIIFKVTFFAEEKQWTCSNVGLSNTNIRCLKVLGNKIFVGTNSGLFSSTDSGKTWNLVSSYLKGIQVQSFAELENKLIIATSKGVYISIDGGATWEIKEKGLSSKNFDVKVILINKKNIIIGTSNGIFFSKDLGDSWTHASKGLSGFSVESIIKFNDQRFYAGTSNGLYYSDDPILSWERVPKYNDLNKKSILTLSKIDEKIYAGTLEGLFVFDSERILQKPFTDKNGSSLSIYSILKNENNKLYLGTEKGVYISINNGKDWIPNLFTNSIVYSLYNYKNFIFAGTFGNGVFSLKTLENLPEYLSSPIDGKLIIDAEALEFNSINEIEINYNGEYYTAFSFGNLIKNENKGIYILVGFIAGILLSIGIYYFVRYLKSKQGKVVKNNDSDIEYYDELLKLYKIIVPKKDLLKILQKISVTYNNENQMSIITNILAGISNTNEKLQLNAVINSLNNKISNMVDKVQEPVDNLNRMLNLFHDQMDFKNKFENAEKLIKENQTEKEIVVNNFKEAQKKLENLYYIESLKDYSIMYTSLANFIMEKYNASLKIIDDLLSKDKSCYEMALKILGKLNFSINIPEIGRIMNINYSLNKFNILTDLTLGQNTKGLVEDKNSYIMKYYFNNFWKEHLSSFLIYFEELRNIRYFVGRENEVISNFSEIIKKTIEEFVPTVKNHTGLEFEFVPLFHKADKYLLNLEHVNDEIHFLYKDIQIERGYVWEIKSYGFKKSDKYIVTKTKAVIK